MQAARMVLTNSGGIMLPIEFQKDDQTLTIKARDMKRLKTALEELEKEIRATAIKDLQDPEKTTTVMVDGVELIFPKLPAWMGEGNPG